jgi:hypothetical protein
MKEFVPSDGFVEKTMTAIRAGVVHGRARHPEPFAAALVKIGVVAAGFCMALANAIRLYQAVFAPVISR